MLKEKENITTSSSVIAENKEEIKENDSLLLKNDKEKRDTSKTINFSEKTEESSYNDFPSQETIYEKTLQFKIVNNVTKAGRQINFSVLAVVGNKEGKIGYALVSKKEAALAAAAAKKKARRKMVKLKMTTNGSISFPVSTKFCASSIDIIPAKRTWPRISAGGILFIVLKLAGFKDIIVRLKGRSKNRLNNLKALMKALSVFIER